MPYVVMTSQAKLVNTYVCGPIIVGDKGADPKLMKAVGAKLVTNYPACGSPPLFLVYGNPRGVMEAFQGLGFDLISSTVVGDCRECIIWTLYSGGEFADPNSKQVQTSTTDLPKEESRGSKSERGSKDQRGSKQEEPRKSKEEVAEPPPEPAAEEEEK